MTDELQILKDFVEGKLSDKDFEQQLYTNSDLETLLSGSAVNWSGTYLENTTVFLFLAEQNYKNPEGRLNAQGATKLFLEKMGIEINPLTQHSDHFDLLLSTSPKYIDAEPNFIEKYIAPKDKTLSKSQQKQYIKQRYAELFKYQTKPPQWIQNPNWPIRKEKPLFFLGQMEIKKSALLHDEGKVYLFIDPETGNIETVKQFY
ncbi:hypothetical protein CLU96_3721 [Chryseobacterium sp. 52]|uniref:hypothetical protein n=1 Tax=Chryseobacterium sp. 52 TaxID=2035213 RepID=UPI000C17FC79|nr:hypothetical protein [Chryseobacterium sp. 52]PIF46682.1 hypothetical protein CLU96_3721 [Chryseobacterium sp. 52]